jgi:HemY protein
MIRLLLFFGVLLAAAFGLAQVADLPGHVIVAVGETEYRVSLLAGLIALGLFVIAVMVLWTILRLVFRLPTLMSFAGRMRRQAKGQQAVARGLVAIGVGDQREAERHAADAQRLLGREPLALLLKAQTAQLSGDQKSAEAAFRTMLDTQETAGLGMRGLFIEAQRRGDEPAARLFAEEAYRRSPQAPWASAALLGYRAAERNWRGAISIVEQNVSRRIVDRDTGRAQRAVLLAAEAIEAQANAPDDAQALALEALRIAPDLVPAVEIAARRASAKGDYAKASKLVETAWKTSPHPDLADAYLNARPGDSALDRLKRARTLLKLQPAHRESRFAVARAAIDAREFIPAREALDALVLQKPTARACLLMAELEEIENHNAGAVRSWLARASRAPRDPAWVADGIVSETWMPVSPVTGRIGAFEWIEPPQASEQHLRARIDADRFEQLMAATEPAGPRVIDEKVAPELDDGPATDQTATTGPAGPPPTATVETRPAFVEAEAAVRAAATVKLDPDRPIIPDDPGPDPQAVQPKKRFSLFG